MSATYVWGCGARQFASPHLAGTRLPVRARTLTASWVVRPTLLCSAWPREGTTRVAPSSSWRSRREPATAKRPPPPKQCAKLANLAN